MKASFARVLDLQRGVVAAEAAVLQRELGARLAAVKKECLAAQRGTAAKEKLLAEADEEVRAASAESAKGHHAKARGAARARATRRRAR